MVLQFPYIGDGSHDEMLFQRIRSRVVRDIYGPDVVFDNLDPNRQELVYNFSKGFYRAHRFLDGWVTSDCSFENFRRYSGLDFFDDSNLPSKGKE